MGQLPRNNHFSARAVWVWNSVFKRHSIYFSTIPLAALLAYVVYRAAPAAFSDFAGYYFGSLEILRGNYQTTYDTQALNLLIAQKGYSGVYVSYTPFPPFTAMVFAPFLWLPVGVAKIVFNIISAALFVWTLIRTIKFFSIPWWMLLVVPVIFLIPIRNNIFLGQAYLLLTVLLLEGFMAYKKERHVLAALLWSVAILFKIFPVCILFFLLVRKQYRLLGYCVGICALLGLLSLLCTGFDAWRFYVFTLLPRLNNGELNDSFTYVFQSAFMLLKNLLVYDPVQNPDVLVDNTPVFVVAVACFKALVLAGCVGITVQKKVSDLMAFAVWITGSLLISPNGSTYSLNLLLIPLLAWDLKAKVPVMVILFFICNIPVQWFADVPVLLQYPRLYLLLLFFVMLFVMAKTRLPYKMVLVFWALLILADVRKFFPLKDDSRYLLATSTPLMIYDLTIQQNKLVYYYWDDKGSHAVSTAVLVNSAQSLPIQNNQLYYQGKQITFTNDWKKKALLINGQQIIYLSDNKRGVGFYTLRTITPG